MKNIVVHARYREAMAELYRYRLTSRLGVEGNDEDVIVFTDSIQIPIATDVDLPESGSESERKKCQKYFRIPRTG